MSAPDSPDPIAALEARIAALDAEIGELEGRLAQKVAERERCAAALLALTGLTGTKDYVNVKSTMLQTHRVQISKSRTDDKLAEYANEAHTTMTGLAEAVGRSTSLLSQARHNKCSIAESVTLKIQELTKSKKYPNGFEANKRNWPKIRIGE